MDTHLVAETHAAYLFVPVNFSILSIYAPSKQ